MASMKRSFRWQGIGCMIVALLFGCSSRHLPNAPEYGTEDTRAEFAPLKVDAAPAQIRIAFAPFARSKPVTELSGSEVREKAIGKRGGILAISHENTRAVFTVPPRALNETVTITMQVFGSGLQSVVEFGPGGLHFDRSCALSFTFPADGIVPDILGGYLLNDDGTTTEVPSRVITFGNRITVILQIDHFSQYGMGDGDV